MSEIKPLIDAVLSAQEYQETKNAVEALRQWKDRQTQRNDQVFIAELMIILFNKGTQYQYKVSTIAYLMQTHNYPKNFNVQQKKELMALTPTWVIDYLDNPLLNTQGESKRLDEVGVGPGLLLLFGLSLILASLVLLYLGPLIALGTALTGAAFITIGAVYLTWAGRRADLLKQEAFNGFGQQKLLLDYHDVNHADTPENRLSVVNGGIEFLIREVLYAEHTLDKEGSYLNAMNALNLWRIKQKKPNDQVFIVKLMTILFYEGAQEQVLSIAALMARYNYPEKFNAQQKEELMALIPPRLICALNPSSDTQEKLAKLPEEFSGFWSKLFVSVSWGIIVSSLAPFFVCLTVPSAIGGPLALLAIAACLVVGAACLVGHLLVREKWVQTRREDLLKREALKDFGPQEGPESVAIVPSDLNGVRPSSSSGRPSLFLEASAPPIDFPPPPYSPGLNFSNISPLQSVWAEEVGFFALSRSLGTVDTGFRDGLTSPPKQPSDGEGVHEPYYPNA